MIIMILDPKAAGNILLYWADDAGIQIKKDMETININKL